MALIGLAALFGAHAQTVRVVATPNPAVFPLLLALHRHPDLPVQLIVAADGLAIDRAFSGPGADALVALFPTVAAKTASGSLPPMRIAQAGLWRGFSLVTRQDDGPSDISILRERGVIVSGPTTGGRGGAPDLLLRAATSRAGLRSDQIEVCYIAVREGVPWWSERRPLGEHANCEPDKERPAAAILLAEPATTAVSLAGYLPRRPRARTMPLEPLLHAAAAPWPADEFPLGGLAFVAEAGSPRAELQRVDAAYREALAALHEARAHPWQRLQIARTIADRFKQNFGQLGLELPLVALWWSLGTGSLLFHPYETSSAARRAVADAIADLLPGDAASRLSAR